MSDGWKNVLILIFIWLGLMFILWSNPAVKNFLITNFSGIFKTADKANIYKDEILYIDQRNVFTGADFHSSEKVNIYSIIQQPSNPMILYAGTDKGLFVSSDNGANWYKRNLPKVISEKAQIYQVSFNAQQPNEASILVVEKNKKIIYKSYDGFYSVIKVFEIDDATFDSIAKGRSISILIPVGDKIFIGTQK